MKKTDFRGPWTATGWENIIVNTADGNTIACAPTPRKGATLPEIQAFARLIAAAPAMLDALAYVVNWHREHDSGEGELFGRDYVTACISALRKADPEWRTTPDTGSCGPGFPPERKLK